MKCPSCTFSFSELRDICPRCLLDVRQHKWDTGVAITDANASYESLVRKLGRQPRPRLLNEPSNYILAAHSPLSPSIPPLPQPESEEVTDSAVAIAPEPAEDPESPLKRGSSEIQSSKNLGVKTESTKECDPTVVITTTPALPDTTAEPTQSAEQEEGLEDNFAFFASLEDLGDETAGEEDSTSEELTVLLESIAGVTVYSTLSPATDSEVDDLELVVAGDEDLHLAGGMIDASNPDEWDLNFDDISASSGRKDGNSPPKETVATEDDPFSVFSTLESIEEKSSDESEICLEGPELPPDVMALLQESEKSDQEEKSPKAGYSIYDTSDVSAEEATSLAESPELEVTDMFATEISLEVVDSQAFIHADNSPSELNNPERNEESGFLSLDAGDEAEIENLLLQLESSTPMLIAPTTPPSTHEKIASPVQQDNYEGKTHYLDFIDDDSTTDATTTNTPPTTPGELVESEKLTSSASSESKISDQKLANSVDTPELTEARNVDTLFDDASTELSSEQHDFELSLFQLSTHEHSELIELYFELASEALVNPESELKYVDLAAVASSKRRIEAEKLKGEVKAAEQRLEAQKHRLRTAAENEALLPWSTMQTQSAPLRLRLLALTIDLLLAFVASLGFSIWLLVKEHSWLLDIRGLLTMPPNSILVCGLCYVASLVPPMLVVTQLLTLPLLQGSMGMRLCGIRLIRIDGGPIAFLHALVRSALGPISLLSGSSIKVLFKRPSLADRLSRTRQVVVLEPANEGDSQNSTQANEGASRNRAATTTPTENPAIPLPDISPIADSPPRTENPSDEPQISV